MVIKAECVLNITDCLGGEVDVRRETRAVGVLKKMLSYYKATYMVSKHRAFCRVAGYNNSHSAESIIKYRVHNSTSQRRSDLSREIG